MEKELKDLIAEAGDAIARAAGLLEEIKARFAVPEKPQDPAPQQDPGFTEPIDIELDDIPQEALPSDAVPEPEAAAVPETGPEAVPEPEVVPDPEPEPAPAPAPAPGKATAGYLWETDIPGSKVSNILSAISLNDRVLFINVLFREDARLFRDTVAALNSMQGFGEAKQYIMDRFRDWNLSSETVYRLMMAVRRKFQ
ncbi:MAG: hypothetical protein II095_03690 [Bacteroidales bacterium]|nr:hypothetical protein [Bacteroidales bacterium]